ncbi:MAG: hypothetical protein ABFQ53_03505, partial [Patescibacteria group bacterium]
MKKILFAIFAMLFVCNLQSALAQEQGEQTSMESIEFSEKEPVESESVEVAIEASEEEPIKGTDTEDTTELLPENRINIDDEEVTISDDEIADIEIIARVNIFDAKIAEKSEDGRDLTLEFSVVNNGNVQPQIQYIVELYKID